MLENTGSGRHKFVMMLFKEIVFSTNWAIGDDF